MREVIVLRRWSAASPSLRAEKRSRRAWIFVARSRSTPRRTEGLRRRWWRGVDVAGRRRCRRARFVYVCVWRERRGKRSSASLNRAQHTRTHPPTRLLSILWRARFACNIYTPTRGRAHRWCYVWFRVFIIYLFFIGCFRFLIEMRHVVDDSGAKGRRGDIEVKTRCIRRGLILS